MQGFAISGDQPRLVVFPGQGTPELGMGKAVCDSSPATTAVWDCASDISGTDVRKLCQRGPMTRLTKTCYQQLAVTTVNTALYVTLRSQLEALNCAFAGHSAGEYTALYAAGVFDLERLFQAITFRANLMQELAERRKGMMYVIKDIDAATLRQHLAALELGDDVTIACDNTLRQQVLAGDAAQLKTAVAALTRLGFSSVKLAVNGAWHTALMADGVSEMQKRLDTLPLRAPVAPILMNKTAATPASVEEIKTNLALHLTHPVRWRESMDNARAQGYRHFLEISHKKLLSHMLADHFRDQTDVQIQHCSELQTVQAEAETIG